MRFLVRPYNADGPRLQSAVKNKARLDGIVVDAHITKLAANAVTSVRGTLDRKADFFVDPVTHKMRRAFFRAKKKSFQRLPYFFADTFGDTPPRLKELDALAADGAAKVHELQKDLNVTAYLSPYLHVEPDSFTGKKTTPFAVGGHWATEFMKRATDRSAFLSVCVAADCLTDPDSLAGLHQFLKDHPPKGVYLLLFDWDLGDSSPVLTTGVLEFLHRLRDSGVERVIYSHAPSWIYFLASHGVTDFVSGINFLSTLKREHLDRDGNIGGIIHNYYIPRRFCRMTPRDAEEAINLGLLDACECPACEGTVPDEQNRIREHYLHVRGAECHELKSAAKPVDLLRDWCEQTEDFLAQTDEEELKVHGDPNPTQWRLSLP